MKNVILTCLVLSGATLIISGCGKTAEMKNMERDLFSSITAMHDKAMGLMHKANDMSTTIDEEISRFDSLAALHPKEVSGHSTDELKSSKGKLSASVAAMKNWMSGLKPYDESVQHEEMMAQLNAEKDGVTKVISDLESAVKAATAALDTEKTFQDGLAAKLTKTRRKPY